LRNTTDRMTVYQPISLTKYGAQ